MKRFSKNNFIVNAQKNTSNILARANHLHSSGQLGGQSFDIQNMVSLINQASITLGKMLDRIENNSH